VNKKIIQYILPALTIIISFFSFLSVYWAIKIPEASTWLAPTIWFSLLFVLICLSVVIVKNKIIIYLSLFLTLLPSIIFSFNTWHFLVIIFCFLLLLGANARIKGDIDFGKKIKLSRSLRFGKAYIYVAMALVISSQYYFLVKDEPVQKLVPDFKMDGITNYFTPKIFSAISPNFSSSLGDETTVDQFIIQMQENQLDKMGYSPEKLAELPPDQRAVIQKQIDDEMKNNQDELFAEGRKKFSDLTGREVSGSEKISDILSEVVNSKINNYITPKNVDLTAIPIVPIFVLVLFLTVASLGSFMGIFLVPIAAGIFRLLVKLGFITIAKVQSEVEIIEQ
jgi:hypothetical protein